MLAMALLLEMEIGFPVSPHRACATIQPFAAAPVEISCQPPLLALASHP
jgi:hypothetical protein